MTRRVRVVLAADRDDREAGLAAQLLRGIEHHAHRAALGHIAGDDQLVGLRLLLKSAPNWNSPETLPSMVRLLSTALLRASMMAWVMNEVRAGDQVVTAEQS